MSRFSRLMSSKPSRIWSYGVAVLSVASAMIISLWSSPHIGFPGTLFLCVVMLSAWFGGVGPGLVATMLSTLAFHYSFLHPINAQGPQPREMPRLIMYIISNLLIGSLSVAQRTATESLKRTNEALHAESRERGQAEKKAHRSEAYLAEAERLAKTGTWAYNPATEKALYWSDEMFRMHGLDPRQGPPTSEAFLERVHPEDRKSVHEAMWNAVRKRTAYEVEHRIILPNGMIKHIHALGHPVLNPTGDAVEVVGSAVDVTERERFREIESNLAHMNRVSMMGELAAALAHEIKQPIAAAITNANTSLRWLARDEPDLEEARKAIMRIANDGKRAAEIINRLRSFYTKGAPPQLELVDLNEVAREMLMLLRDEAVRYSISTRTELAPEVPSVMIDRVQLQQVFMNLMLNAIEAMKESAGELAVKSELSDEGQLLISVSDTGVGLPPEKLEQIFDAFFTTKSQGTGMGLAITRSIIEAHHGRVWASANPGGGAIFQFTLPATVAAQI